MYFCGLTLVRWKQDAITVLDKLLPEGYQEAIIVGGGVGGWIATLIALERPEKGTLLEQPLSTTSVVLVRPCVFLLEGGGEASICICNLLFAGLTPGCRVLYPCGRLLL